ncbi:MAG: ribonuclease J [Parcubacteria group bacterium]|nr:ribonuclease J [Parcubacteria group bacterium]
MEEKKQTSQGRHAGDRAQKKGSGERGSRWRSRPATGQGAGGGRRKPYHGGGKGGGPHKAHGGRGRSQRQSGNAVWRDEQQKGGHGARDRKPAGEIIPPLGKDSIRIIPLGGVEEVGRNMTAIEYGNDILIVDCGIQFQAEETPGIDYILPNTRYLEDRKEKIRAMIITHGHLDHIGGIPYIMPRIGNPPIYTRLLTLLMVQKRQTEFPELPPLNLNEIKGNEVLVFGELRVRFFAVTHTIPDAAGVIIETPHGVIVHTGDLKLEHKEGTPSKKEEEEFGIFAKEKVLALLADSTNVEKSGWSIPESVVFKTMEDIIKNSTGRLIIGTFASQIERIARIIEITEKYGKKIIIDGRSMKQNVEIAMEAGILKPQKGTIVPIDAMDDYSPEKIIILVTGAQGDEHAVLMRVANKGHKYIRLSKRDTIVLSSSIIPGNELAIQRLKDNLARQGANIVHYQVSDVHSSGHANQSELEWIHKHVKPRFFIPIHGFHYMLTVHGKLAQRVGMPEDRVIIPDNGAIIEIQNGGEKIVRLKEMAARGLVLVDGFSIGDIQEVVLRDRQMLAQDGMFVLVVTLDVNTGKLRKSPDIISRGFVYLRESQELLTTARTLVKKTVEKEVGAMHPINFDYLKGILTDEVSKYLFQKTNKRPIVIPVILGI